jgi:hypothetical protein
MSTTAQESQTAIDTGAPATPPAPATQSAATEAPRASSSRSYTLFEEARTDTWTKLGEVEAGNEEDALNTLGEQKLKEAGKRFMAIPSRFVRPRKPKVDTVTTISYD